ncbi:MAG: methyltransferase domain-containing protein [Bacteroidetes bacterium]|nr:methyltransferase domain-containing protein [Bacteroidota bacterium]
MDKKSEEAYHQIEEWNWWFVSRRKAIINMLKEVPKEARILDIGCAGGPLLQTLKEVGYRNVCGADFSPEAVAKCVKRGLEAYEMDAQNLTFEANSFDVLIASDNLEHLQHDTQALDSWFRVLKPGGKLIVFVPAYLFLWSEQDVVNHHYRRYTKNELKTKVQQAGFYVQRSGYWNFLLFFPTSAFRMLQQIKNKIAPSNKPSQKNQLEGFNPVSNRLLIFWLSLENSWFKKNAFPFGVSAFAEAKKPSNK